MTSWLHFFKRQMLNLFDKSESVFKWLFLTCWVNSDDVIMMMALASIGRRDYLLVIFGVYCSSSHVSVQSCSEDQEVMLHLDFFKPYYFVSWTVWVIMSLLLLCLMPVILHFLIALHSGAHIFSFTSLRWPYMFTSVVVNGGPGVLWY